MPGSAFTMQRPQQGRGQGQMQQLMNQAMQQEAGEEVLDNMQDARALQQMNQMQRGNQQPQQDNGAERLTRAAAELGMKPEELDAILRAGVQSLQPQQ